MPSVYAFICELTNVELLIVMPLADPLVIVTLVLVNPLAVPPLMVTLLKVEPFDVMVPLEIVTFVNVSALAVPPLIVTFERLVVKLIGVAMFVPSLYINVDKPAGRVTLVPVAPVFAPLEIMTA